MAVSSTPVFVQTPKSSHVQILPADASALKTLYTAGANGSKITAVLVASTDTASRDVTIGITNGGTFYPLGTFTVAIQAGTIAAAAVQSILSPSNQPYLPVDNDGQTYIFLVSGETLQVKSLTTVTAAKELDFTAFGADF